MSFEWLSGVHCWNYRAFYWKLLLSFDSCFNLDVSCLWTVQLWWSIFNFAAAWGSSFTAIHHIFEKKKAWEGRGVQMWEVGFWLHWQLWGTEVFQSRKWLDLPCGSLTHPGNSPHCFEHPGSPQAPTEGSGATADRQGRENPLVQAARTLDGAESPRQNKTEPKTWLRPLKRLWVSISRCELRRFMACHVLPMAALPNRKLIKLVIC